jgi:hypothetical protein
MKIVLSVCDHGIVKYGGDDEYSDPPRQPS